jgi:hypothetical protein
MQPFGDPGMLTPLAGIALGFSRSVWCAGCRQASEEPVSYRCAAPRLDISCEPSWFSESLLLWLCIVGRLGVFAVGYPGYFVFNAIWPSFYYSPIAVGKNAWLLVRPSSWPFIS